MEYDIIDIERVLSIKSQLIVIEDEMIEEIYEKQENYLAFVQGVISLINLDGSFLMIHKNYRDKIRRVIQIKRFDQEKEVREAINDVLSYLNKLETYQNEEQQSIKNQYVKLQEELHSCFFESDDILEEALAYDAVVYISLKDDRMEDIESDDFYLSSLNYLAEIVPEFFREEEIRKRADQRIDQIILKSKPWEFLHKSYAKTTKKILELTKEE